MESFGKLLREARENKSIDIEKAAFETSISKNYIEAMELEQIELFPAEIYLLGFLRNYSDYLGLNTAQILALYRGKKIQESPAPMALLQKQTPKYVKPLIISGILLLIVGLGILFYFLFFASNNDDENVHTVLSSMSTTERYELSNAPLTKRVYKGDVIVVPTSGGNIDVIVANTLGSLQLMTPAGTQFLELSEERELDIDGQNGAEIIVYLSEISKTDEARGAEIRVLLKDPNIVPVTTTDLTNIPASENVKNQQYVILEDNRAYPFTINVTFRSSCVFRYKTDNNTPVEDYYIGGSLLTMQASNGARIWVSNINAVKLQIIADSRTYDLEVGKAGQVVAQDIKWVREANGIYKLAVIELD
ncbi:MAG: hypothetical protein E7062_05655 [Spirochaetaceae bacterium]|nr:hypothetical protein [Spirochaetaceae bacterium]